MRCPLCNETIANDSELQLHYLLSCSAYSATRAAEELPSTAAVRFRWVKARPCIEEEIHLISSLAGSVILHWNESEGSFESELTNTPVGQHLCQLAVSGDVLPTEDFVVSADSDVIYIILTQDDLLAADIPGDVSITGDIDTSRDELQARIASPLHDRRDELTLDIGSHHSEEHDPQELSPLHRELLRHQVIHGEPSWVPRSGHEFPLLSEEVGFPSRTSVHDPPLLTTEPAYLEDLRRRSPVPMRHGVEISTEPNSGQKEAEKAVERLGSAGEQVRRRKNDASIQDLVDGGRRSSSSSSSHCAASSTQSSSRPSPVNSNPDAREDSLESPFLEEQLLPQSRGSPESPFLDNDLVPEIVGVEQTLTSPSPGQVRVGRSSPVLHLIDGHMSSDITGEEVERSHQSSSRASPLGSVLDEAGMSNGFSAPVTGTDPSFEHEPAKVDQVARPSPADHHLYEVAPGASVATQPPPGRISPTGSAFTDSERLPRGTSPFTSPRVRSHSDINRTVQRMSPSTSLHSEPQSLLDRTGTWRTGPYRGDAPEHPGESLPDTTGRRSPAAESSRRSHRESPAGSFRAESPLSSRTGVLSIGSNHSSRQGTPPLDFRARSSSGEPSGGSGHSSRASSIRAESRRSTESESSAAILNRSDSAGEVAAGVTDSRTSSLHDSRNSSTHTSPRTHTDVGIPLATPTSHSGLSLHDRPNGRPASAHSGSRRSSGTASPLAVPSSDEVPLVDTRRSLHDSRHDSHPEATRSGAGKSASEGHSSREAISRTVPAGAHVYGSNRSSRNQSPISQEVSSLLEILRRKEQKAKKFPDSVKSSKHQTSRLQSPPEVLRQVGLDGALQSGHDRNSRRQIPFSSGPSHRHRKGAPEAAPSSGVPFIPSRGTAFQVVNGDGDPSVVASSAEMEALKRERDGLVQELKIRTAHFEQELRKMKMRNEDMEQQVLSIQMAASLSQDDGDKQKETERSLDALKSALRERETEICRLEEREAEMGHVRKREEEIGQFQERIEELEKENRLLKEEHESVKTVNQIRMDDARKVKADLELELTSLRRSLRLSSHRPHSPRDLEQITRLKESCGSLEHENRELKRQLEKTKPLRTTTDCRLSKARSETDLSAKYSRKYHDTSLPTRNVNFSVGTESSGLGSSRYTSNDVFCKYVDRSSALTNGDLSRHSVVGQSVLSPSPYESNTRRRFGSVGDDSEVSDVSDLDRSWPNGFRHRTISSESSTSSGLFSAADHDQGPTNGYRSPRPYSPVDYGHSHAKRRGQRPHSFHGDVGSLADYYTKDAASTSARHPRSTTSGCTAPKIVGFNSVLHSDPSSRSARHSTTKSYVTEQLLKPFAPTSAGDVRVGSRVLVTRTRGKIGRGVVKYVGSLPGRTDTYVGVELDNNEGKHDGSFDGQRFFRCKPNYGIFVSFNKVVMCYG